MRISYIFIIFKDQMSIIGMTKSEQAMWITLFKGYFFSLLELLSVCISFLWKMMVSIDNHWPICEWEHVSLGS